MLLRLFSVLSVLFISGFYLVRWEAFFNSDFAMIGLIGKRILETGENYFYVPSVGYQGLLVEGYLSALLFRLFGTSPQVLHLTAAIIFLFFIFFYYLAVRNWFNETTSALAIIFLSFSSPFFFAHVLRTQPNYGETFAIGSVLFWLFGLWTKTKKTRYFYLSCFASGFGFYLYGQVIYFVLSILVCYIAHQLKPHFLKMAFKNQKLNIFLGAALLISLVPSLHLAGFLVPGPSLGVLGLLICVGSFVFKKKKPLGAWIFHHWATLLRGTALFLLGYLPSFYHRFVLGLFAKSGIKLIKFSEELWLNFKLLFLYIQDFMLGLEYQNISRFLCLVLMVIGIQMIYQGFKKRRNWLNPFWVLGPLVVVGFLSSRSVNEPFSLRYILCLHLVLAISLSVFTQKTWAKSPKLAVIFCVFWVFVGVFSNWRAPQYWRRVNHYPQLTQWQDVKPLFDYLIERKVSLGYSDYWPAYLINFISMGKITLEPTYTNYLPFYEELLKRGNRIALIKAKTRLAAGPDMSQNPQMVGIFGRQFLVLEKRNFEEWVVWILEADKGANKNEA